MSLFIEVDYFNLRKNGEKTSGDIFLLEKLIRCKLDLFYLGSYQTLKILKLLMLELVT